MNIITLKNMNKMVLIRILKAINEKLTIAIFCITLLNAQISKFDNT